MNGIERILQRIQTEAQTEIDEILKNARDEAAAIQQRYQTQAEAETAEWKQKKEKAAAEQGDRLLSVAQMESRKMVLATKQDLVEQAYALALEKLCAMPEDQRVSVMADLLVRASASGDEEVIVSPEDHTRVGAAAVQAANKVSGKQLTLSSETRPIKGGFILKSGNIEINCTFDTLVRLQKTGTAGMVAKKLFG